MQLGQHWDELIARRPIGREVGEANDSNPNRHQHIILFRFFPEKALIQSFSRLPSLLQLAEPAPQASSAGRFTEEWVCGVSTCQENPQYHAEAENVALVCVPTREEEQFQS